MDKWTPTKAGLYPEMTREEYDACDAMNQSTLKHGCGDKGTMLALKAALDRGPDEPTPTMAFGSLVHACILEPDSFEERYYVWDKSDAHGSSKAGIAEKEAAYKAAGERTVVLKSDYEKARQVCVLLEQTSHAMNLLNPDMLHECAAIWQDEDTDVWCKALVDGYLPGRWILDIKTTRDASPWGFRYAIRDYGYDIQAAFYLDAIYAVTDDRPLLYGVIALQPASKPRHSPQIGVYWMDKSTIDVGRQEYKRVLGEYAASKRLNCWQSYTTEITEIGLPPSAMHGGVLQETF